MSIIYSIKNLSFTYPSFDHKVLSNVCLDISEGDIVSILGRNGAGKSTLLNCMLGLIKPGEGEIFLSDRNLQSMTEREIASVVGYVPQTHTPAFGYTVFDFVQMGCAHKIGLFSRPGKKEYLETAAALKEVGIDHLSDRPYTELSGGERQQAIIARAIVMRPRIILFDEPTAHLDIGNQIRVLKIIKQFSDKGYAVVFTTHNPDHSLLLGGKTAILDNDGHLRCGKTEELITEESLKCVYSSDIKLKYIEALDRKVCLYPNL